MTRRLKVGEVFHPHLNVGNHVFYNMTLMYWHRPLEYHECMLLKKVEEYIELFLLLTIYHSKSTKKLYLQL